MTAEVRDEPSSMPHSPLEKGSLTVDSDTSALTQPSHKCPCKASHSLDLPLHTTISLAISRAAMFHQRLETKFLPALLDDVDQETCGRFTISLDDAC